MARAAYIYAAIFVLAEKQVFYMKRFFSFFFANTCNRTCTCSPLATCNCILATVSFCSQPGRTSSLNTSFTTALTSKGKSKQLKKKNYTHFWRAQLRSWKTSSYSCTSAQRHHCNRLQLQRCTTHDTKQAAFDCASVQPTNQPASQSWAHPWLVAADQLWIMHGIMLLIVVIVFWHCCLYMTACTSLL